MAIDFTLSTCNKIYPVISVLQKYPMSYNKDPLVGRLIKTDHIITIASIAGVPALVIWRKLDNLLMEFDVQRRV